MIKENKCTSQVSFLIGSHFSVIFSNLLYLFEKLGWQVLCNYFDCNISCSLFRMVKNRVKEKFLPVFASYAVGVVEVVNKPKCTMNIIQ